MRGNLGEFRWVDRHFYGNIVAGVPCLETLTIYEKNGNGNRRNSSSIWDVSDTTVIVPVTGAVYHNGNEKPTERWCFELVSMRTVSDKDFTSVLSRLQKGFGIKEKCAMVNICITAKCNNNAKCNTNRKCNIH